MARSPRLKQLQKRITELRRHSLPSKLDETEAYSARVFDRTRGFRVLAHAEIEACLEDLGVQTVNAAYQGWAADNRPRTTLTALMTFTKAKAAGAPDSLHLEQRHTLRGRLDEARKSYVNWVKNQNHGIREANVLGILLPAGIREHEINAAWLQTIDSFGDDRGDTAHQAGRPETPPHPASEFATVRAIIEGLIPLDIRLQKLRNE